MKDINVLLTGATGFVGKRYLEYKINSQKIKPLSFENWKESEVDIFKNIDTIVHLAGIAHRMEKTDPDLYFSINYRKTCVFADVAKKMGVRHFIFISTIKVFGEDQNQVLTIHSPCKPQNDPYGESKLQAENYLKSIEDENFVVSIIRPPLIYGPGVKGNLIKFLELGDMSIPLPFKDVKNKRTMIFLDNFIELVIRVIESKKGGLFLAGDRTVISTEYLISEIRKNLKKPASLFKLPSFLVSILTILKPELIKRLYGSLEMDTQSSDIKLEFTPPYSSEYGIKQMVDWYKSKKYINE